MSRILDSLENIWSCFYWLVDSLGFDHKNIAFFSNIRIIAVSNRNGTYVFAKTNLNRAIAN